MFMIRRKAGCADTGFASGIARNSLGAFALVSVSFAVGCVPAVSTGEKPDVRVVMKPADSFTLASENQRWDAGIVIPGSTTTIAFPISDERVTRMSDIVGIKSSCECTSAAAMEFLDTTGQKKVAVQVSIHEGVEGMNSKRGRHLIVALEIRLASGAVLDRDVYFVLSGVETAASL